MYIFPKQCFWWELPQLVVIKKFFPTPYPLFQRGNDNDTERNRESKTNTMPVESKFIYFILIVYCIYPTRIRWKSYNLYPQKAIDIKLKLNFRIFIYFSKIFFFFLYRFTRVDLQINIWNGITILSFCNLFFNKSKCLFYDLYLSIDFIILFYYKNFCFIRIFWLKVFDTA